MLAAVVMAFINTGPLGGVIAMLSASALTGGSIYWMWKSGAWDRFVLAANLKTDDRLIARESEHRSRYLGKQGLAVTPLRPTGVAEIEGERIEVTTEGGFISAGSEIKVVAMDRRHYFVRLVTETATA